MNEYMFIKEYIFDPLAKYVHPKTAEVETQKQLLAIPWIKQYSKTHSFGRYSISEKEDCKYLMVENDLCTWWKIIAILPSNFPTTLCNFKSVLDKHVLDEEDIK